MGGGPREGGGLPAELGIREEGEWARGCRTSKWVCPALDGRAGGPVRGNASVEAARRLGLPVITPPADWQTSKSYTNRSLDFTPDPDNPNHQRNLAQREYYGSRRSRRLFKRRSLVEGVFGILKNPSRRRLRGGQHRLPVLVIATIIAAINVSVFNEEQLRAWHARTGNGPADHPLLQPDAAYHGFVHLTKSEAEVVDAVQSRWLNEDNLGGEAA